MPVETGRGRSRHYTGNQNLGQLVQWDCPSCGAKHETVLNPPEKGCPECGAGVPGEAGTAPAASATGESVARPLGTESAGPGAGTPAPVVPRPGTPVRPTDLPLPMPAVHQTVYRVIEYTGTPDWLEATLRRSLVGRVRVGGTLTATIVDDVSPRQQDLLTLAKRQPGVWLGQPTEPESPRPVSPPSRGLVRALYDMAAPSVTSPVTPMQETRPMDQTPTAPPTGPAFTEEHRKQALMVLAAVDFRGCYTLAMALNQFAATVEDETMEREKFLSPGECLSLANALLQLVPEEWTGEQEPAAAPEGTVVHDIPTIEKD